jgi:hypothetical protein
VTVNLLVVPSHYLFISPPFPRPSFFFVRQLWLTFTSGTLGTNMSDTYIGDVPRPALPTVVIDRWGVP